MTAGRARHEVKDEERRETAMRDQNLSLRSLHNNAMHKEVL